MKATVLRPHSSFPAGWLVEDDFQPPPRRCLLMTENIFLYAHRPNISRRRIPDRDFRYSYETAYRAAIFSHFLLTWRTTFKDKQTDFHTLFFGGMMKWWRPSATASKVSHIEGCNTSVCILHTWREVEIIWWLNPDFKAPIRSTKQGGKRLMTQWGIEPTTCQPQSWSVYRHYQSLTF